MSPEALMDALRTSTVSPYEEMLAFEYLYVRPRTGLRKMTEETVLSGKLPSQLLYERYGTSRPEGMDEVAETVDGKIGKLSLAVNGTTSWPEKLADSDRPTPLFYYRGDIGLMDAESISIVGSRKASPEGVARARRLAREMVAAGVVVVSGLAHGIDTAAMTSALESGGRLIGVIGTPIDECYPRENAALQDVVSKEHLLVSQVPFFKYSKQSFQSKKHYFPERNELMAAISDATVIVEASDTSGTLTQARACLAQGRKLFILKSCYENEAVSWPRKWAEKKGVFVASSTEEILDEVYGAGGR